MQNTCFWNMNKYIHMKKLWKYLWTNIYLQYTVKQMISLQLSGSDWIDIYIYICL